MVDLVANGEAQTFKNAEVLHDVDAGTVTFYFGNPEQMPKNYIRMTMREYILLKFMAKTAVKDV